MTALEHARAVLARAADMDPKTAREVWGAELVSARAVVALGDALPKLRREHGEGSMMPGDSAFGWQWCNPNNERQALALRTLGRPECFCGADAHNATLDALAKMLDEEE